jgi:hypothetical protein
MIANRDAQLMKQHMIIETHFQVTQEDDTNQNYQFRG